MWQPPCSRVGHCPRCYDEKKRKQSRVPPPPKPTRPPNEQKQPQSSGREAGTKHAKKKTRPLMLAYRLPSSKTVELPGYRKSTTRSQGSGGEESHEHAAMKCAQKKTRPLTIGYPQPGSKDIELRGNMTSTTPSQNPGAEKSQETVATEVPVELLTANTETTQIDSMQVVLPSRAVKKPSFLDLPKEIRLSIYPMCIENPPEDGKGIISCIEGGASHSEASPPDFLEGSKQFPSFLLDVFGIVPFGLLACNRQIHAEATEEIHRQLCVDVDFQNWRPNYTLRLQYWFQDNPLRYVRELNVRDFLLLGLRDTATIQDVFRVFNGMSRLQTLTLVLTRQINNFTFYEPGYRHGRVVSLRDSEMWEQNINLASDTLRPEIALRFYITYSLFTWCGPFSVNTPVRGDVFQYGPRWVSKSADSGI